MRDPNVFTSEWRAGQMVPSRQRVLEDLAEWLETLSPENADDTRNLFYLYLNAALDDGKFTAREADEWFERSDRRYEEVTGRPAPPPSRGLYEKCDDPALERSARGWWPGPTLRRHGRWCKRLVGRGGSRRREQDPARKPYVRMPTPEWRAGQAAPSRKWILVYLAEWTDTISAANADRTHEMAHLLNFAALYDRKFTPDDATEWRERLAHCYGQVTGQPAPPPPPNRFPY